MKDYDQAHNAKRCQECEERLERDDEGDLYCPNGCNEDINNERREKTKREA